MNRKWKIFSFALFSSILLMSGCANEDEKEEKPIAEDEEKTSEKSANEKEEEKDDDDDNSVTEDEKDDEMNKEEEDEKEEEDKKEEEKENETSGQFSDMIQYMEEESEGEAEVIYENDEPQTHESAGLEVTLNGYTLLELKDFHTNFNIPFDRESEGAVILAEYTIKNTNDDDIYFMPDLHIEYPGTNKYHDNFDLLTPREEQIKTILAPSNDYEIKAGDELTGYYAYPFSPETYKEIMDASNVTVAINRPHLEKGDVTTYTGEEGKFTLNLSSEGEKKAADQSAFYEDKATYDDMGEKKMIEEKSDLDEEMAIGDINVKLDGYQFTEFTPNEAEAKRFENFENGVVLLTVRYEIDNESDQKIAKTSQSSKLTVNDGTQYLLGEGMLLNYRNDDLIEPGKSDELLQVFVLEKEQYEKIWKDKSFVVEIGPLRNEEGKDVTKGKRAEFTLPRD